MEEQLQQTLQAAQGGLTNLDPAAGLDLVESWIATLQGANLPPESTIVEDLRDLADRLQTGNFEGLGQVLTQLAGQTTALAGAAPGEVSKSLQQLGSFLSGTAQQLG